MSDSRTWRCRSADLAQSIDFYARYARMRVVHQRPGAVWISDQTRPFVIVLLEARQGRASAAAVRPSRRRLREPPGSRSPVCARAPGAVPDRRTQRLRPAGGLLGVPARSRRSHARDRLRPGGRPRRDVRLSFARLRLAARAASGACKTPHPQAGASPRAARRSRAKFTRAPPRGAPTRGRGRRCGRASRRARPRARARRRRRGAPADRRVASRAPPAPLSSCAISPFHRRAGACACARSAFARSFSRPRAAMRSCFDSGATAAGAAGALAALGAPAADGVGAVAAGGADFAASERTRSS